jgi:uncharacterized DUF497 family protein
LASDNSGRSAKPILTVAKAQRQTEVDDRNVAFRMIKIKRPGLGSFQIFTGPTRKFSLNRLDHKLSCIYDLPMLYRCDERKRRANLKAHKLDFRDAPEVFDGLTVTYEDDRFDYGEQRYVTLGFLKGIVVSIVHTETEKQIRIISFRKATRNEEAYLFKSLQN